jgi:inner membrane transporter RhtA
VLLSLEPVLGALSGWLFLHQRLEPVQWLAIVCVVIASGGVAVGAARRDPELVVGPEPP